MTIEYISGGVELLDEIGPLWEKLKAHHARLSPPFRDTILRRTFARRRDGLLRKAAPGKLRVDLARSAPDGRLVGYVVSTIDTDQRGEVDSIFVEEDQRGTGVGRVLMERTLAWLDQEGAQARHLEVRVGNEGVFEFYRRFGFEPATIRMDQTRQSKT